MGAQTTPGIERAPFSIKNELKVSETRDGKLGVWAKIKFELLSGYENEIFLAFNYRDCLQMVTQTQARSKC